MTLPSQKYQNNYRTVTGSVTVRNDDVILNCDTSQGAVTLTFPAIPANSWNVNQRWYIVDSGNMAATNNITLVAGSGQTIDLSATKVINVNSNRLVVMISSNTSFITGNSSLTTGTVTSVGLALPVSVFTVTNSPVTTSGTLTGTFITQTANTVFAGPTTGSPAVPTFRSLVVADLPTSVLTAITVKNTVYVMKNGSDSTGLVERFDKPFLTILAATNAAVAAFTSRTQSNRVRIIVEDGNYVDIIQIYDFIDYDLGNCVIDGSTAGTHTINVPSGRSFTTTTDNVPNVIIYGNAIITNSFTDTAAMWVFSNLKIVIHCNTLFSSTFRAFETSVGNTIIYAKDIHNDNTSNSVRCPVSITASSATGSNTPNVEIHDAKIYTKQTGSINQVINFYNGQFGIDVNTNYSKLSLYNCQVGSWSTTQSAIGLTLYADQDTARGYGILSLFNTTIFSNAALTTSTGSINDYYTVDSPNARGDIKVYNYGSYANKSTNLGNPVSAQYIGNVLVDPNVQFNNGVTL